MSAFPMDPSRQRQNAMDTSRSGHSRVPYPINAPSQSGNQMTMGPPDRTPIATWLNTKDDPFFLKGSQQFPIPGGHAQSQTYPQYIQYRNTQTSECDTVNGGLCPSDSGYASMPGPHVDTASIYSYTVPDRSPEIRGLANQIGGLSVVQGTGSGLAQSHNVLSMLSQMDPNHKGPFHCPFTDCKKPQVKTRSELNKHRQRHLKPFKCLQPDCKRSEGFGTQNDLDRHMKSVHSASGGVRYRCHHDGCKDKDKLWPRADNFKAHLQRSHNIALNIEQLRPYRYSENTSQLGAVIPTPGLVFGSGSNFGSHIPGSIPNDISGMSPEKTQAEDEDLVLDSEPADESQYFNDACGPSDVSSDEARPDLAMSGTDTIGYEAPSTVSDQRAYPPTAFSREIPASIGNNREERQAGPPPETAPDKRPAHDARAIPPNPIGSGDNSQMPASEKQFSQPDSAIAPPATAATEADSRPSSDTDSPSSATTKEGEISLDDVSVEQLRMVMERLKDNDMLSSTLKDFGFVKDNPVRSSETSSIRPSSDDDASPRGRFECPECRPPGKTFLRQCELTKHMKRHNKPYGCTFAKCPKKFGSKNDWKRHENSQHFQLEIWKCDVHVEGRGCGKSTIRREVFKTHLKHGHSLPEKDVDSRLESCRIGRGCEGAFWCGFCKKRVALQKRGREGWDERFNHIDDHFFGRSDFAQQDIADWEAIDAGNNSLDDPACDPGVGEEQGTGKPAPSLSSTKKRKSSEEDEQANEGRGKRVRREDWGQDGGEKPSHVVVTCCECNAFSSTEGVNDLCPNDRHELFNCDNCYRERVASRD